MNDLLPPESFRWQFVENAFREQMHMCGFAEVRTPLLEATPLFRGSIGEGTDVVEKEMYSFVHRDDALTLRPEGTAGTARAYLEHKVHNNEPVTRWYYLGAMFRAERPQKGRYRQFHQLGGEVFGDAGPGVDAEVMHALATFLKKLGIEDARVLVNSIGGPETRRRYREALVSYFSPFSESLTEESKKRLVQNPLRILDSKNPKDVELSANAPAVLEYLSAEDRAHFDLLCNLLTKLGVPFEVDPRLVRGLDYYTRTLFEIKAAHDVLGAGDTVCGGGRYDGMFEKIGGPKVPAFGFGAGVERLLLACNVAETSGRIEAMIAPIGEAAYPHALALASSLREAKIRCEPDLRGASLKSVLRRANDLGAKFAIVIGDREIEQGRYAVKNLGEHSQADLSPADIASHIRSLSTGIPS